jgi:hypothetical protein
MQTTVLNNYGPSSVIYRFLLSFSDLTAAATTQTIALFSLTRGTFIKWVRIKHTTAFAGGAISAMTVSVGSTAGSATTFAAAFNVFQTVADGTLQGAVAAATQATYAADTLNAYFTSTSANVNAATAGAVFIDVEMWMEPNLTATAPVGTAGTYGAPTTGGLLS